MPCLVTPLSALSLFDTAATRRIEATAAAALPPHTLMRRAGLATARLALALAPHARTVWIACGPGNNGGDGLQAAMHLRQWGGHPVVTWLGRPGHVPADAQAAWQRARDAGVHFADQPPADLQPQDLCIDALLGIGAARAPDGRMADWLRLLHAGPAPLLAVDLPTGLHADTGAALKSIADSAESAGVNSLFYPKLDPPARHTLSLLTLKPGLFTARGRDACGQIWFDDLGVAPAAEEVPTAWLNGPPAPARRPHASHKGSYGDVAVIGGEMLPPLSRPSATLSHQRRGGCSLPLPLWERAGERGSFLPRPQHEPAVRTAGSSADTGADGVKAEALMALGQPSSGEVPSGGSSMAGAALLAARAALHAGAGRVYVGLLGAPSLTCDPVQPELMFRPPDALPLTALTVVCGCGGGSAVATLLPAVLESAARLVLDADALNALAADAGGHLSERLRQRARQNLPTVLTPHPLEAARLLGVGAGDVQHDRLAAAQALAARFQCAVVLKGSGSIVAALGQTPRINPTGNARLASPGTGDVLAGLIGARLAAGLPAFRAACASVYQHGAIADGWNGTVTLTAGALARALTP